MAKRLERGCPGGRSVPLKELDGIHAVRALESFPLAGKSVHPDLARAFGKVKLACAGVDRLLCAWGEERGDAIERACREMTVGFLTGHVLADALQGGAGTTTNMNANEVLAKRALVVPGGRSGDSERVSSLKDINLRQSTDGTYPTSLSPASIRHLRSLEEGLELLRKAFQEEQRACSSVVTVGRTRYQDAVPITPDSDLLLLSFGPDAGLAEIALPKRQAGSSTMSGKVNPGVPVRRAGGRARRRERRNHRHGGLRNKAQPERTT